MFINEKALIKVTDKSNKTYTGTIYKTAIVLCEDDNNRPHTLMLLSQDKKYIEQDGDFGCVSLWVEKIKRIEIL